MHLIVLCSQCILPVCIGYTLLIFIICFRYLYLPKNISFHYLSKKKKKKKQKCKTRRWQWREEIGLLFLLYVWCGHFGEIAAPSFGWRFQLLSKSQWFWDQCLSGFIIVGSRDAWSIVDFVKLHFLFNCSSTRL